jgi:hypothetical protein
MVSKATKLQAEYDSLIEEASRTGAETQRLSAQIAEIHQIVPDLARELENIREECEKSGVKFDPDNPEAPGPVYVNQKTNKIIEDSYSLNATEMDAYRQIRDLEKKLTRPHKKMLRIKQEFQTLVLFAYRKNIPFNRNSHKEAQAGLVANARITEGTELKRSKYPASKHGTKKKPGPKGSSPKTIERRGFIKWLHAKGSKGLEACKLLNIKKIPIPSKKKGLTYQNNWVEWFRADPNGFYKQWHADLKRR